MSWKDETFKHISEIDKNIGKTIKLRGWVYRQRAGKNNAFIVLRDATGHIQCVVRKESAFFSLASGLGIEASIELEGTVKKDERAPTGYELEIEKLKLIGESIDFPINKDQSTEFLMDVRHLWLRSQKMTNMLKARNYMIGYLREWLKNNEFWEVHAPIFTTAGCEGGSTLFPVDYFGKEVYLSQSGQMHMEIAIHSLERVYTLTPSFRAEKSKTTRHLTEYWHLEAEEAFVDNKGNMEVEEEMISHVCQSMAKNHSALLKYFGRDPKEMKSIKPPFERLSYEEMLEELKHKGVEMTWGDDPGAPQEKALTEDRKEPIFVYNYPRGTKAFYMKLLDEKHVACADMLAPEGHGEIIGGSEREWRIDELKQSMETFGLKEEDYSWYLDLRRYGSIPHSGFGLGIERTVKWILSLDHIRDAIPFPRTLNRTSP
ncbi:asparagine--tRNA ligase [archaeon]|nr:asparagine--tRNA ligase [archaeon]